MPAIRAQHAAVLLPSGKLLVINGVSRTGFVTTADLYDPATGAWTAAGSPGIQGNVTQAVLLPNGKVFAITDGSPSGRLFDPATGSWTPTGSMSGARSLSMLTLLNTGKVLVSGGGRDLATTELYDPTTNAFTPTGSMTAVRRSHLATLLNDGRVLAVSGFSNAAGEVPGAELYSPAAGTWTAAAPPLVARHYASGTLLPDGRVLVAGGFAAGGVTTHCEIYNPATNTWTATAALAFPRNGHHATLLPNGKVLVTGGSDSSRTAQTVSELYDPAIGTWSSAGTMLVGRENHTAALLPSGKVMVAGGYRSSPSLTFFAETELYDPGVSTWSAAGTLGTARNDPAVALLPNGKVLAFGGHNAAGGATGGAELYDRTTNAWTAAAALTPPRDRATASLLPTGRVIVVGGLSGTSQSRSDRYDPVLNTWSVGAPLAQGRHFHTATLLANGKLLVFGGQQGTTVLASGELYDAAANTWTATGAGAAARSGHAAVALTNGKVLVAGGRNAAGAALASTNLYAPTTNTWSAAAPLAGAREGLTLTLLPSGKVLAAGGLSGGVALATTEVYDPVANTWTAEAPLAQARWQHTAALMPSGKVLAAGGLIPPSTFVGTAEAYDPANHAWTSVSSPAARGGLAVVALPSGEALVVGGTGTPNAQRYDDTGAQSAWRPVVTTPAALVAGCPTVVEGQRFRGISEASSGSSMGTPTDFPLVRFRAAEGGRLWTLPATQMSATRATVSVPSDAPPGAYALSVFANAIPGGRMVNVVANTVPASQNRTISTPNNTPVTIVVASTDPDVGQGLTWSVVTPPQHGTLSGNLPSVVYTPTTGYVGPDSFRFKTRDCGADSNIATVTITVVDRPPTITCPGNTVLEATTAAGAPGVWPPATASDTITPNPTITYAPALGAILPVGNTTVTATARDGANNTATCTFQVAVRDTTAPSISCPSDVVLEATSPQGAEGTWPPATSVDGNRPAPGVTYSPAMGTTFALGTATVTATARDAAGNESACTFPVTVEDTTPPTLTCPQDKTVPATSPAGSPVSFSISASDIASSPTVTASPASGSVFPPGPTTVNVTATDGSDHVAKCTFTITVEPFKAQDAGAGDDAGTGDGDDAGTGGGGAPEASDGCGCRQTAPAGIAGYPVAVLVGAAIVLRRRRRSSIALR